MEVTVKHNIPDERIQDLLCSAFADSSNYWIKKIEYIYPRGKSREDFTYSHIELPLHGGSIIVTNVDGEERTLDRNSIERGLKLMAEEYPKDMSDFLNENDDAYTADLFLQLCLFREEVYS